MKNHQLYGGNVGATLIRKFGETVENAFNCVGFFSYSYQRNDLRFEVDSFLSTNSFDNEFSALESEEYLISDLAAFKPEHSALFDNLETIIKSEFGLSESVTIQEIAVSARSEMIVISYRNEQKRCNFSAHKTAADGYHDLIAAHPVEVFSFTQLARAIDAQDKRKFVDCVDVPFPGQE